MKRDFDLIRLIIQQIGTLKPNHHTNEEYILRYLQPENRHDKDIILEHLYLLKEAGLIEADVTKDHNNELATILVRRLSWSGQDFLSAIQDDTLWKRAKEKFLKPGVSYTFDLLFQWLKSQM